MTMSLPPPRHAIVPGLFAAILVAGSPGCGAKGSPTTNGSAGTGGIQQGTGGQSTGGVGSTSSTGGAVGGEGGASTGGRATGGNGAGGDTGGASTGGRATGGKGAGGDDGGARDSGASVIDSSVRQDARAEVLGNRDGAIDRGLMGADATPADSSPPVSGDAGITIPSGYKLVWADEFDVDGAPNPKNWNYEKGFARNEELQWYQPDNATVKDGLLVIEGRKERVANPNYKAGSSDWKTNRQYAEYTSTSMTTSNLQSWQYGRFEMRARIPTSAGMWPAWWTLGVSGEWPSSGEIDIMEYYKGNVLANVACGTATRWQAKWDSSSKAVSSLGAGWANNFHVWRMDWDDQKIDLYLDDVLMNTASLASMLNADGTSPFKQKNYMLVNLAIGGSNGGDPAGTTFPQRYEVDWIRVYQKL
jgi:beta-glucanase (GH16 family)